MEINKYYDIVVQKLIGWSELLVKMLPNFVLAVVVLIAFFFAGRLVRNLSVKLLDRAIKNKSLSSIISKVIYIIVLTIGAFAALTLLDLDKTVSSLLAGAGIIGLALGFAFQDIATNFIAGFFMAIKRPFKIGQVIHCEGYSGIIKHIGIRTTELASFQGQEVIIPNKMLFQNPLVNDSENTYKRIDLNVGVSYGEDLERVRDIAIESVKNLPNINKDKDIDLVYLAFGSSSIDFRIMIWVAFKSQLEFLKSQSEAIIAIKKAFDKEDIMIPFPIRTLDFGIKGGEKLNEVFPQEKMQANSGGEGNQKPQDTQSCQ
ncbi:mechanosensitive ion channel family protein [Cyclobacterium qasimii]|uniref:Potassium efflux system KefA protein n=2 Tax=Cyclobacterium qasimii TaxID=1350429 RepID=S7VMB4_9BACT|nr:mechanosensitive ion channel domain-containing protein [Cyclobacterium qasimii]EPR71086.1 Potassium efflux system KefA protein [Cyclobacterium qasimii M12-11B]GEO21618.1 mechanosensitive ion channel protein MscS [Cyclobacterium qasimii]